MTSSAATPPWSTFEILDDAAPEELEVLERTWSNIGDLCLPKLGNAVALRLWFAIFDFVRQHK
jgi:hypothetical protein